MSHAASSPTVLGLARESQVASHATLDALVGLVAAACDDPADPEVQAFLRAELLAEPLLAVLRARFVEGRTELGTYDHDRSFWSVLGILACDLSDADKARLVDLLFEVEHFGSFHVLAPLLRHTFEPHTFEAAVLARLGAGRKAFLADALVYAVFETSSDYPLSGAARAKVTAALSWL